MRILRDRSSLIFTVDRVQAFVAPMATRLPFRYGIAEMTAAPHVLVQLELRVNGAAPVAGFASEHLPPKWFVKDPATSFAEEVAELTESILHAAEGASGGSGSDPFQLWRALDESQVGWCAERGMGGLPGGLGTALVERALIDASCRALEMPFVDALDSGALGFDPGAIHPELAGVPARPAARPREIAIRHTVGLGDPLTDADVVDDPRDGLPVSLESAVRRYGVHWLKLKTVGEVDADVERIRRVEEVCAGAGITPRYTIDGNESMTDGDQLLRWLRSLLSAPGLTDVAGRLVAVEQPVHRSRALEPDLAPALRAARALAPVIIDESDADVDAVREAMDLGYAGGTYKGCKGVFRGLANASLVAQRGASGRTLLTAEDLCTVPPLTVGQDLVVAAAMGLPHVERNGHHYFGRLAPLGSQVGSDALSAHPDVYEDDGGTVRLRIHEGSVSLGSLLGAPFGFAPAVSPEEMVELTVAAATALV